MSLTTERAALWVRYLGGDHTHCAETFVIPTMTVPERVKQLRARGDVAEIWYQPSTSDFDSRLAHKEWPT